MHFQSTRYATELCFLLHLHLELKVIHFNSQYQLGIFCIMSLLWSAEKAKSYWVLVAEVAGSHGKHVLSTRHHHFGG
jgi:hypothetical protein